MKNTFTGKLQITHSSWVVMISMNRKHWHAYVDIRIFIIYWSNSGSNFMSITAYKKISIDTEKQWVECYSWICSLIYLN